MAVNGGLPKAPSRFGAGIMIYDPYIWFTPAYIIQCGVQAEKHFTNQGIKIPYEMRDAINESRATAIACFGFNKLLANEFRVQLVSPKERSPDTRVIYEIPAPTDSKYNKWAQYWDMKW